MAAPPGFSGAGLMELLELLGEREAPRMHGAGTTAGANTGVLAPTSEDPIMGPSALLSQLLQQQGGGRDGGGMIRGGGGLMTVNGVTMRAPAIQSLQQARQALGIPIFGNVVSSHRTRAEQAELYRRYKAGTGNLAAPPGQSLHESGWAVDIASSFLSQHPRLRQWLLNHGWHNDVEGEPWHWSYGRSG